MIRFQMNDFGIVAMLPDGRVEVLDKAALPVIQEINSHNTAFSSEKLDPFVTNEFDVDPENFHLAAPVIAFLEITNLCNLTCQHCYAHSAPNAKRPNELSFEEITGLLDEWERLGVLQVFLSGGEIFAHPRAVDIINYAREKNFLTQIFSNGLLIKEEHLANLKPGTSFFVSFDSATASSMRGKMTLEKLDWLNTTMRKYGHVLRTAVNVHSRNLADVRQVFAWSRERGFTRPQWLETLPVGRALRFPELVIEPKQSQEVFDTFSESMEPWATPEVTSAERVQSVDTIKFLQRLEQALECDRSGRFIVYVTSHGEVYPSSNYASHGRELAGSLRDSSFEKIWQTGFSKSRNSHFTDFKACADCPVQKKGIWCQFRCRSLSENIHGDSFVCGATEHIKDFMIKTDEYYLKLRAEGRRLQFEG